MLGARQLIAAIVVIDHDRALIERLDCGIGDVDHAGGVRPRAGADAASARIEPGSNARSCRSIPTARRQRGRIAPASHDDLDRVPTTAPTVRAASRVFATDVVEEVLGCFDHHRLWCRRLKRRTGGGEPGPLVAAGEQPVVAQEASDEGGDRRADRASAAGLVVAHSIAGLNRRGRSPRGHSADGCGCLRCLWV